MVADELHQGVKVGIDKIGYFPADNFAETGSWQSWPFELGMKVIAPLKPITENSVPYPGFVNITETIFYPGFVIEIPKADTIKHGNKNRALIFFECGIWRYVAPEDVAIHPGYFTKPWESCSPFPKEVFNNAPRLRSVF